MICPRCGKETFDLKKCCQWDPDSLVIYTEDNQRRKNNGKSTVDGPRNNGVR